MEMTKTYQEYITSLKKEVVQCRMKAVLSVNKELILLYWKIGKKILEMQEKEGWGAKIVQQISKDLKSAFPDMTGLSERNLKYMRRFALEWMDFQIVQQLAAQIPWMHNCILLDKIHSQERRLWYINKTIENGWSRNVLALQIESKLYERQGNDTKKLSNFKETLPPSQSDLAQSLIKDPYNFEFLGIAEEADEKEIEKNLEQQVSKLLLEMGTGFAYMGRQYPIQVGGQDFWIDMLFYNVKLRAYVAVELKAKPFKPSDVGQLNFYLSAIDRNIKHPDDNPTIGLMICRSKNGIIAEYALDGPKKPMGISEFTLKEILPDSIISLHKKGQKSG